MAAMSSAATDDSTQRTAASVEESTLSGGTNAQYVETSRVPSHRGSTGRPPIGKRISVCFVDEPVDTRSGSETVPPSPMQQERVPALRISADGSSPVAASPKSRLVPELHEAQPATTSPSLAVPASRRASKKKHVEGRIDSLGVRFDAVEIKQRELCGHVQLVGSLLQDLVALTTHPPTRTEHALGDSQRPTFRGGLEVARSLATSAFPTGDFRPIVYTVQLLRLEGGASVDFSADGVDRDVFVRVLNHEGLEALKVSTKRSAHLQGLPMSAACNIALSADDDRSARVTFEVHEGDPAVAGSDSNKKATLQCVAHLPVSELLSIPVGQVVKSFPLQLEAASLRTGCSGDSAFVAARWGVLTVLCSAPPNAQMSTSESSIPFMFGLTGSETGEVHAPPGVPKGPGSLASSVLDTSLRTTTVDSDAPSPNNQVAQQSSKGPVIRVQSSLRLALGSVRNPLEAPSAPPASPRPIGSRRVSREAPHAIQHHRRISTLQKRDGDADAFLRALSGVMRQRHQRAEMVETRESAPPSSSFTAGAVAGSSAAASSVAARSAAASLPSRDAGEESKLIKAEPSFAEARRSQMAAAAAALSALRSEEDALVSALDVAFVVVSVFAAGLSATVVQPQARLATKTPHAGVIAAFLVVELLSLAWMLMRFHVRSRRGDWDIVDDLTEIRRVYLRGWFSLDCVYSLPLELIFLGWSPEGYHYASLRHFIRAARVVKLGSSSNPLLRSRHWFRFVTFILTVFLVFHCTALLFWALQHDEISYLTSLWWAMSTMTTVGYGDVVPTTTPSRAYGMVVMISGVMMVSSFTAFATSFLTTKDPHKDEQDRKKNMMHSMLTYYRVPWDVQKEIIGLFPAVLEKQSQAGFGQIAANLPAFMKSKLDLYVNAKLIRKIPFFAAIEDEEMMLEVSSLLQQRFVPPFENIVIFGEVATEMFFLTHGVVEVVVPDDEADEDLVIATLRGGSWFGEMALLVAGSTRQATVQSISSCELLVLSKDAFSQVEHKFPTFTDVLRAEAKFRATTLERKGSGLGRTNRKISDPVLGRTLSLLDSQSDGIGSNTAGSLSVEVPPSS